MTENASWQVKYRDIRVNEGWICIRCPIDWIKVPDTSSELFSFVEESRCPLFGCHVDVRAHINIIFFQIDLDFPVRVWHVPFFVVVLTVRSLNVGLWILNQSIPLADVLTAYVGAHFSDNSGILRYFGKVDGKAPFFVRDLYYDSDRHSFVQYCYGLNEVCSSGGKDARGTIRNIVWTWSELVILIKVLIVWSDIVRERFGVKISKNFIVFVFIFISFTIICLAEIIFSLSNFFANSIKTVCCLIHIVLSRSETKDWLR